MVRPSWRNRCASTIVAILVAAGAGLTAAGGAVAAPPLAETTVDLGTLPLDGLPHTYSTTIPGDQGALTFTGTAGRRIALRVTRETYPGGAPSWTLRRPDGTSMFVRTGLDYQDGTVLATTGTYRLMIDPPRPSSSGSITITGWDVPPDLTSALSVGGPRSTVTVGSIGQDVAFALPGRAGRRIALIGSGRLFTQQAVTLTIYAPDGRFLKAGMVGFLDSLVLPTTGSYTVVANLWRPVTGALSVRALAVPADQTAALPLDGTPTTATFTRPGQNAGLTFGGHRGQRIAIATQASTFPPGRVSWQLVGPDGRWVVIDTSSWFGRAVTLPLDGTYTLRIDPYDAALGSITLQVWDVPADLDAGPLPLDGTPTVLTVASPGQTATLHLDPVIGKPYLLRGSGSTFASGATWTIYDVSGARYDSGVGNDTVEFTGYNSGGYTLVLDPDYGATGSITFSAS